MAATAKVTPIKPAPFAIETDVPIRGISGAGADRKPFRIAIDALAAGPVGASFFIPEGTHGKASSAREIASATHGTGWFTCRKVEGGQRIWKLAEPKARA